MRRFPASVTACAVVTVLLFAAGCVGVAVRDRGPRYQPPLPETPGYVEVENIEHLPGPQNAKSLVRLAVRYVNDTRLTFSSVIIWCRVYDADGYQLGARRWELLAAEVGPMRPGFKTRQTLGVSVDPATRPDDATCSLKSAT